MDSPISSMSSTGAKQRQDAVDKMILREMRDGRQGQVFSPAHFSRLGSRAAVDKALSRLVANGTIRRVARGLYDIPLEHKLIGKLLPSIDEITNAIASKESLRLQPSGAYAANLLGLTEQIPLKLSFLTDGTSRTLKIGKQTIILKRTSPRNMSTAGRISGLVIQALRHLKREHIDEHVLARLSTKLSPEDKTVLRQDKHDAPAWIAKIIDQITDDH